MTYSIIFQKKILAKIMDDWKNVEYVMIILINWNLRIVLKLFVFVVTIIACVLLIIPLVVYSITPELRSDFHGKACIALLAVQLCILILLPMINIVKIYSFIHRFMFEAVLAFVAYTSSFCATIICYDIHFTFKYLLSPFWWL